MPRMHIAPLIAVVVLLLASACSAATPAPAATPEPPPAATPEAPPEAAPQSATDTPTLEPSATPAPTTAPAATQEPGSYPAPATPTTRPGYPDPAEPLGEAPPGDYTPVAPTAPAPAEGLGVVTGTLTRDVRGVPLQPVTEATLYLAEVLRGSDGELSGLAGLDEESAPSTVTDEDGQFAFTDVEPGLYLLIIKTPLSVAPVRDVDGEDVAADVVAGQAAELGIIHSTVMW